MHPTLTHRLRLVGIAVWAVFAAAAAGAADPPAAWPSQTVRIVVGYPPGTSPDAVARLVAEPLARALGKPVVVENKAGAAGNLGVDAVVKAGDGHTFGITTNGPLTTSKQLFSKLPYDPAKDVLPLSLAATSPLVLVQDIALPPTSLKDFLAWAKAQPDGVTYGSIGQGTGSHLTMELFASKAGARMVHVPFQGFPQVTNAILGHQVQTGFMAPSGALAQARAGKLRLLGVSSPQRSPLVPDVPTIAEAAGIADFHAELWIAAFGPASMPPEVARRLGAEINAVLKLPDVRDKLLQQGWQALGADADALRKRIADDTAVWTRVIQQAKVSVE